MAGLNGEKMRRLNRSAILREVRRNPSSRAELARKLGLTRAAITVIADELETSGMITEKESLVSGVGRPSVPLCLDPSYGNYGGVSIGRESYTVGVADFSGNELGRRTGKTDPLDREATLCRISEDLRALAGGELKGIGIAAPGPLDREDGRLGNVSNFSGWKDAPLRSFFEEGFGCACILDNHSNAYARAEYLADAACGDRYLFLFADDGFGSALAEIGHEVHIVPCELGHITVDFNGPRCDCGNFGCAELYVREDAEGEPFYRALASVIVGAMNIFGVDRFVFAGKIFKNFFALSGRLERELSLRGKQAVLLPSALYEKKTFVSCNLVWDTL